MIYESVRKMTVKEQIAFDLGYAKALGEIERLTAERDRWKREFERVNDEFADAHPVIARLIAERDAALRDLKHMDNCDICAHGQAGVPGCDVECEGCKLDCACRDCRNEDNWQWRGPCAENRRKEK